MLVYQDHQIVSTIWGWTALRFEDSESCDIVGLAGLLPTPPVSPLQVFLQRRLRLFFSRFLHCLLSLPARRFIPCSLGLPLLPCPPLDPFPPTTPPVSLSPDSPLQSSRQPPPSPITTSARSLPSNLIKSYVPSSPSTLNSSTILPVHPSPHHPHIPCLASPPCARPCKSP